MLNHGMANDESKRRIRAALGVGLLFIFGISVLAATGPGITWDEPSYVAAGYGYCLWLAKPQFVVLSREDASNPWLVNHEHPPAAKIAYGLAGVLERGHGLLAILTARIVAAALFTALVGLVYLFTARHFGRMAGAFGAASLALMPRVFGHGHLAALDVPVALACFAATLAFSRAWERKRWAVAAGLLWGVALLTKLNAVFLPVVLIPWALWVQRRRAVLPCTMLLILGSATFVAGWPWLWSRTWDRVREYAANKVERMGSGERPMGTTNIPVYYMGSTYRERTAPWHYPFVLTLVTVPLGLLALAGLGVRPALAQREDRGIGALFLASGALHLLVAAVPGVPKYDGVRLFLPAFPFVACLAGIGAAWAWKRWKAVGRGLVAAIFILAAAALYHAHPYELSYYNALVGGAWGARKLGFETTYWGDTVNRSVIAAVNTLCPPRSKIAVWPRHQAFLESLPWMRDDLVWLRSWGPGQEPPDFLILFPRQGMLGDYANTLLKTKRPVREWTYHGVPQCMLFDLRSSATRADGSSNSPNPLRVYPCLSVVRF